MINKALDPFENRPLLHGLMPRCPGVEDLMVKHLNQPGMSDGEKDYKQWQLNDIEIVLLSLNEKQINNVAKMYTNLAKRYNELSKNWCCTGKKCTKGTCVKLPDDLTCGDCVHTEHCVLLFGAKETNKYCDFLPRRFSRRMATAENK